MKKFLIFIILTHFYLENVLANESSYESSFYKISINNELISDAKIREINFIKYLSLINIFEKILLKDELNKLSKSFNFKKDINYLIKNIIIENEFISATNYSANIKINFDIPEIIKLFRNKKINYTDIESSEILLIASENNNIFNKGLDEGNNFYKLINQNNYGLINLIVPKLSINDRFILPYEKITTNNLKSYSDIAIKYNVSNILIFNVNKLKNNNNIQISFFSLLDKNIENIGKIIINENDDYEKKLFNFVNMWWKNKFLIENNVINKEKCTIINNGIDNLIHINNKINSISQIKSNKLISIKLDSNINNLIFYGKLSNVILKLSNKDINLQMNNNNECIISLFK